MGDQKINNGITKDDIEGNRESFFNKGFHQRVVKRKFAHPGKGHEDRIVGNPDQPEKNMPADPVFLIIGKYQWVNIHM
jgi:hypothetical protein